MTEPIMPEVFQDLEPFVHWAVEPEIKRTEQKVTASMDEVCAFYEAMMARIDEILDYLQTYFGKDMPAPTHRLYLLTLSLVEVATLVELYKRREIIEACDPLRFEPQH